MNCIVNVDQNWGIGKNDQLLFTISADLKRFRTLTTGKTVILGRKTLATSPGYSDIPSLLRAIKDTPDEELCVIGGASVYEALLPYCKTAQITKTLEDAEADRFFPNLDTLPNWSVSQRFDVLEENGIRFQYIDYQNTAPLPR